ncbi:hypothetical protein DPV78_003627 [Talaromyces pinophilus]|nr:hypothetical protein DPV78_003627 [Talaromyces pinophilus]
MHCKILISAAAVLAPIALAIEHPPSPIQPLNLPNQRSECRGIRFLLDILFSPRFHGHQNFLLSHVLDGSPTTYPASVLDVTNPSIRAPNSRPAIPPTPASTVPPSPESVFNFTTSKFSFASTSPSDGLSQMRTWSNYNDVHFDLTFSTSSPRSPKRRHRQLRGHRWYGLGMVHARRQDNWHANSERHGTGSISTLNPLGAAYPNGAVLSVWNWKDDISGNTNFATIRDEATGTQRVLPVTNFTLNMDSVWTSPHMGYKWVQDFELVLRDGTSPHISSLKDDQELWDEDDDAAAGGGSEGYMTVTGTYKGIPGARGFAVSEQLGNLYASFS